MNIIRTESDRSRRGRVVAAAGGLAVGCCLLFLAGPIAAGALAALPGDTTARDLRHRSALDGEQIVTLIATRSRAIDRYGALDWRRELATASVMPQGDRPVEQAAIDRATAQTRKALEQAPASPHDWLRLSILAAMAGDRPVAADHLSMALLTGADMPRLRCSVLDVGFALWGDLPGETRAATLTTLRHAWRTGSRNQRRALLVGMRDRGLLPLAQLALAQEDRLQAELDWLRRNRRPAA
ncbi:hypothetical protein [Emcibacter sp. SYSU 3D8]|uniref:hypothetical protein n=1 Tax=Emcibacter sp. SYSU 3D8 TaxID=3133969 RepID=UPI0031FF4680